MFRNLFIALAALLPLAFAQRTTVYTYTGTTTCQYAFSSFKMIFNSDNQPMVVAYSLSGNVTLDLANPRLSVPNAPVTPGFVTGGVAPSYPIIGVSGTSAFAGLNMVSVANVTNVVLPAYIFLGVGDGSNADVGFTRDSNFSFYLDRTGLSFGTDNSSFPVITIVLATVANQQAYSETHLTSSGYPNGDFTLSRCTRNTFTVTARVIDSTPTSTGTNPGGAVGDPSFVGFRGQRYQIHGMADTIYNIISDQYMLLNAEFVFLTHGQCPHIDGIPLTNCWSHPGSYFGSLGLVTANGDQLLLKSGPASEGFQTIELNNNKITEFPTTVEGHSGNFPVTMVVHNPWQITLNSGLFEFQLENSDMFVNIMSVKINDWHALTHKVKSHGLLGQTWDLRKGVIQGTVDDYVEANNELFGHQFLYNKFSPKK